MRDDEGSGLIDIRMMAALQARENQRAETIVSPPSLPLFAPLALPVLTPARSSLVPWWASVSLSLAALVAMGSVTLAWLAHRTRPVVITRPIVPAPPAFVVTPFPGAMSCSRRAPVAAPEAVLAPRPVGSRLPLPVDAKAPRRKSVHTPRPTSAATVAATAKAALSPPTAQHEATRARDPIDILLDQATGGK